MSGVWAPAPACCQVQEERRCCVRVLRSLCGWVLGYLLFGGVRGGGPLRSVFSLPALSGGTHVRSPTSSSDSEEFYSVGSCGLDVCPMYSVPVRCGVSRCACLPRIFVPCWKRFYVVVRCGSWWRAGSSHLGAWVEMSLVPLPSSCVWLCCAGCRFVHAWDLLGRGKVKRSGRRHLPAAAAAAAVVRTHYRCSRLPCSFPRPAAPSMRTTVHRNGICAP